MKRIAPLVLLMIFLSSLLLIQSTQAYENSKFGFSMTVPSGWSMQKENEGAIAVMFTDPSPSTGASINVVVEETRATLSGYVAAAKSTLASTFDDYHLVSEGSRVIGGLDCYELVSTYNYSGHLLKVKQVAFVENGKAFIITCGALESQYVYRLADFENSIMSFRITSQPIGLADIGLIVAVALIVAAAVIAIVAIFFLRKKKPASTIGAGSAPLPPPPEPSASPQVAPSTQTAETKFCRYCGERNKTDAEFCEKCGKKIG